MKKILEPIEKLMRAGLSKENRKAEDEHPDRRVSHRYGAAARRTGLFGEEYFLRTLHLERKRSERCLRPFCLMLLDLKKLTDTPARRQIVKKISSLLHSLTRETDIKGWYEFDSVIGVIFTETDRKDGEVLGNKIRRNLDSALKKDRPENVLVSVYVFPEEGSKEFAGSPELLFYPDLSKRKKGQFSFAFKRMIDFIGVVAGLCIFSPLFLVIPACIKLTSEGPVFFRQERMGQYGKKFTFLKFRTMHVNNDPSIHQEFTRNLIRAGKGCAAAEKDEQAVYKIVDDPRVTAFGRFLRKTSLDELPQFINVIKGEMSIVGPRPPIPYEYENYDFWHRRRVIEIKPGITGLWQVRGRSSTTFDEMVRLDIKYMRDWSLWLDFKIIAQTPFTVLFGKGAY